MSTAKYERDVVYRSPLTGEFYFVRKVKVLPDGCREVVGEKINVTRFIAPYLRAEFCTHWTHQDRAPQSSGSSSVSPQGRKSKSPSEKS